MQRWRRRWFTLKQGELPGQFFLEYFTDSSCRKRKGVIDLDQVEQVDAGLSLDRATIKFQWMFDMKTPNRTYYLAADNEQDMRDWVMVVCQVCNLQETEEKTISNDFPTLATQCTSIAHLYFIENNNNCNNNKHSYIKDCNLGPNSDFEAKEITPNDMSSRTDSTLLISTSSDTSEIPNRTQQFNDYENDDVLMHNNKNNNPDEGINYSNLPPTEPTQIEKTTATLTKSTGAIKKIPENLKLRFDDKINNNGFEECSSSRVSGPYIPLSDCFSGSPVLFVSDNVFFIFTKFFLYF